MDTCKDLHKKCLTDNLTSTMGLIMLLFAIFVGGPYVVLLTCLLADKCKTEYKDYCMLFAWMYVACFIFIGYFWSIYWAYELMGKSKK